MENHSPAPSSSSVPAPNAGQRLADTMKLLLNITRQFTIEPDVTTRDETAERKRNLLALCRVSRKFHKAATRALYEVIDIQTTHRLLLLYRTVNSNPEKGELVRKLFFDLTICWEFYSGSAKQTLCSSLYVVLLRTTNLQLLSLDLKDCSHCFRNSGPEDFVADGPNFGYHNFYGRVANRIRSGTFLPNVTEFRFSSEEEEPYKHYEFFALPSLNCIVSLRDRGAWSMILDPAFDTETRFSNIKELSLRSSALIPSEVDIITSFFPNLETFQARNNSDSSGGPIGAALAIQDLSATLGRMGKLEKLALDNFPTHLGPLNGITSLGGMHHLTELRLGIHQLMCYRGQNSQPGAMPLEPSLLPPALRHLQIYTCFSCWDTWADRLWRGAGQQNFRPQAKESTLLFILGLSDYVCVQQGLPGLETVRLYSREGWWLHWGAAIQRVRHFEQENGEDWRVGCLDVCSRISRFDERTPGIHFRAYETDELDC